jgi:hypothetical protein
MIVLGGAFLGANCLVHASVAEEILEFCVGVVPPSTGLINIPVQLAALESKMVGLDGCKGAGFHHGEEVTLVAPDGPCQGPTDCLRGAFDEDSGIDVEAAIKLGERREFAAFDVLFTRRNREGAKKDVFTAFHWVMGRGRTQFENALRLKATLHNLNDEVRRDHWICILNGSDNRVGSPTLRISLKSCGRGGCESSGGSGGRSGSQLGGHLVEEAKRLMRTSWLMVIVPWDPVGALTA